MIFFVANAAKLAAFLPKLDTISLDHANLYSAIKTY